MLLVFGAVLGVQAEDFIYENDFSSAEGITIVGSGSFVDNERFGKVFQNVGTSPRTNYLLLPEDLLSHSASTKELTIGFWVSAEGYTPDKYTYSPFFTAYAGKNSPNSWPMLALQSRGFAQVNCAGWCDFTSADNVAGKNTAYNANCWEASNEAYINGGSWLEDQGWHFYTAVFTETNMKIYLDGEVKNEWNLDGTEGHTISGLFSNGADLKYICLGGNQAWDWNDNDAPFAFANFYLANKALTTEEVAAQMEASKGNISVIDPGTPAITFEAPAVERTITIGLNAAGTVKVDWGDGSLVEKNATGAYDGYDNALEFSGTPSGTVKIYGEGITFLEAFTKMTDGAVVGGITSIDLSNATTITELDLHQNNLTSLDVSKLTALEKLTIGVNDMETIDLLSNTALTTFDANNTADGKLTSLDLSNNTKLVTLKANYNKISSIDLSNNTSLKNIYLLGNGLTSVDFGNNTTAKIYISLNNNKLESLDVSALTGLSNGSLLVMNNNLTDLQHGAIKTLNVTGNKFTVSTMPKENVTNLTYSKQQNMTIAEEIDKSIDLSAEAKFGDTDTEFVWKTEDGTALVAGTDYNIENGVTTFLVKPEQKVYAELKNTAIGTAVILQTTLATVTAVAGEGGDETDSPAITFEAAAVERTVTVGLAAPGTVKVDWGDGNLVEVSGESAYDLSWDENGVNLTGTPSGVVKIYADGIIALDAAGKFNSDKTDIPNALTSLDVTNAPDLVNLYVNANKLTTLDLSKNPKLNKLDVANNQLTALDLAAQSELTKLTANDNQLTEIDLVNCPKLTNIVLTNNKISTLDFTANPLVKTFTCLNNELTNVTIGANTAKGHTFQFGGNKLTSFSLMECTNLATSYVYLRDNDLNELQLPSAVRRIWVDGNALTLSQLYELKGQATQTFTYATTFTKPEAQQPMEITADGSVVDLSSEAMLGETATVFTWKTSDGTALVEDTDYTVENGVFTFLADFENIYCEMTNAELPAFTAEKPFKTTQVSVSGSAPGEVDNTELLAEIEEAKKLLKYSMNYYDENNEESPETEGKALVDAIRDAETQAETAATQNKIEKTLEALKQAEIDYTNALMDYELTESEAILADADPADELAAEIQRLYDTQDVVREDYSNQPKHIKNYADEIDKAQKAYLRKAIGELIPEAQALADNPEVKGAIEAANEALEGDSSEDLFDALNGLKAAVDSAMGEMTPLDGDVATFEDLTLDAESFWQGIYEEERDEDEIGICYNTFKSGSFQFDNYYSPEYGGFWGNFAYSNQTSSSYESLADQFHAVTGGGHESATFGVAFPQGGSVTFMDNAEGTVIPGFYITNSAYAYTSMLNGDAYAKKFAQGDWFKLTITGLDADGNETGTKEFYLADLRDADSSKHFIVNDWRYVDLSGLGKVKSLKFMLDSSDTGSWGINTPGYFCLDDFGANGIETQPAGNIPTGISGVAVYENAANTPVYNLNGQRVNGNAKGIVIKNGKKYIVK